ncbi:MAG: TatD family hydrolase [Patescibacteria group bacterium]
MQFIDNHAHLNFPEYDADREEVIKRANDARVGIINVGVDLASSKWAVELAEANPNMWAIIGQHPTDTKEDFDAGSYRELLKSEKVVAIGECGLDYFHGEEGEKENQKKLFIQQIELAIEAGKPLMLHIRNAYEDAIEILKKYPDVKGNVHFFAGSKEIAEGFLNLGFTLSFTGVITFANEYEELLKFIPLDRILSETDCPFVSPVPYRGKRNEPAYVVEVVKKIAEIKGLSIEEVSKQLLANSKKLWNLI